MEGDDHPTAEQLSKLRVVDLKARLTSLGLPLNGVKKDLVERLHNHYVEQAGGEDGEEEEESQDEEEGEEESPEQQVEETPETTPEPETVRPQAEEEPWKTVDPIPQVPAFQPPPVVPPIMASPPSQSVHLPPVVQPPPQHKTSPAVEPISGGSYVAPPSVVVPPPRVAPPSALVPPPGMSPSGNFGGSPPPEADLNQMFNPPPGRLNLQFNPPKVSFENVNQKLVLSLEL